MTLNTKWGIPFKTQSYQTYELQNPDILLLSNEIFYLNFQHNSNHNLQLNSKLTSNHRHTIDADTQI